MFGNDEFVRLFGSVPAGDDEKLIHIVSAAVREGIAIVLDKPGTKVPMCILTAKQRNEADAAARSVAAAKGDERWDKRVHACGLDHALTVKSLTGTPEQPDGDPAKVRAKVSALIRRLTKAHGAQPNIGVELGLSNLLVVDVDTVAEMEGFLNDWRAQPLVSDDVWAPPGLTVKSPGVMKISDNGEENWVHKDGGHYWFTLPEGVTLPTGSGSLAAESGWVAMWDRHQVLVPPSSRPEGAYEIVGQISEAPAWLIGYVTANAKARIERAISAGPLPDGTDQKDVWSAATPWAELLVPDGWIETGLPDRCSCPIFTAPGPHGSPKSATAHEVGCDRYDTSPGHAPLHIWTDNPPDWMADAIRRTGSTTFTKLQYLAWRDHDGVMRPLFTELGFPSISDAEFPGFGHGHALETFNPVDHAVQTRELFTQPGTGDVDEDDEEVVEQTRAEIIRSLMIGSEALDDIQDPEPLIDGLLDRDSIARMTGKSGHGKSFVMLDMAGCVALGRAWHGHKTTQGLVVYMVAEGVRGWKRRMRAWEVRYNDGKPLPDSAFLILPVPIQATGADWAPFRTALEALKPALVILDTQARVTVGVDENDATQMGIFVARLEAIRRATGACVVAVHHLGHAGEHGRGSTAVIGALGAEIRVKKTERGKLTVENEKQKDAEEFEPLKFLLDPEGESVVPVPDGWNPDNPFDVAPPAAGGGVTGESSARDRLAAIIWTVFGAGDGCSRAEAMGAFAAPGHAVYGSGSKNTRYAAWQDLLGHVAVPEIKADPSRGIPAQKARPARPGVLVQQISPATKKPIGRWKLDPDEAVRLGLPGASEA